MNEEDGLSGAVDFVIQLHIADWREPGDEGARRRSRLRPRIAIRRPASHAEGGQTPDECEEAALHLLLDTDSERV